MLLMKKTVEIPSIISSSEMLFYIKNGKIDSTYINYLDNLTDLNDELTSDILNISSKTLRSYRKLDITLRGNIKEHLVYLISLFEHGIKVFGSKEDFNEWLLADNMLLDNEQPKNFLDTISGIKFIDDRLTAMEYGDNV